MLAVHNLEMNKHILGKQWGINYILYPHCFSSRSFKFTNLLCWSIDILRAEQNVREKKLLFLLYRAEWQSVLTLLVNWHLQSTFLIQAGFCDLEIAHEQILAHARHNWEGKYAENTDSKTKIDFSFSIFHSHFGLSAPFCQSLSINVNNLELNRYLLDITFK